jgi:predicted transcriptional regulator
MGRPPRLTQRGFKPGARGAAQVLGDLEAATIEVLWAEPNQTVTDVEARLRKHRAIAHTTVLTTLDRLFRKGYVTREQRGKAFVYAARHSPEEFQHAMAHEVLGGLLATLSEPAIATFVELVADDPAGLDRLEALIRAKRAKISGR